MHLKNGKIGSHNAPVTSVFYDGCLGIRVMKRFIIRIENQSTEVLSCHRLAEEPVALYVIYVIYSLNDFNYLFF